MFIHYSCKSDYKSISEANIICWKEFPINGMSGKIVDVDCLKGYYLDSLKGVSTDGEMFHVGHSGDKLYIINAWFIQCPPCIEEIPYFDTLRANFSKFEGDIAYLGLCKNPLSQYKVVIDSLNFNVSHLLNGPKLLEHYMPKSSYSQTYLTDSKGKIIDVFYRLGVKAQYERIEMRLDSMLKL